MIIRLLDGRSLAVLLALGIKLMLFMHKPVGAIYTLGRPMGTSYPSSLCNLAQAFAEKDPVTSGGEELEGEASGNMLTAFAVRLRLNHPITEEEICQMKVITSP